MSKNLTLADCQAEGYDVTCWCDSRCDGRRLKLELLGKWADRKLLDLMREGLIVCTRCGEPATTVSVSSTYRADPVLRWQVGDDAMPSAEPQTGAKQRGPQSG